MTRAWLGPVAVIAAVLALAAPAAAAESKCADADVQPVEAGDLPVANQALECLLSELRDEHGLSEPRSQALLQRSAQRHARDMVERQYFAHESPEGRDVVDRTSRYRHGATRWLVGETLAWGTLTSSSPAGVLEAFLDSPPHRRVLLDPRFHDVGIGVALGIPRDRDRPGATYALDFGRRWR